MTSNSLLTVMLLILQSAYPSFQTLWETDAPFPQEALIQPVSKTAALPDKELARRAEFLQTCPGRAERSRIALSLACCGNKKVFSTLEKAFAAEKDPLVRADILRAILLVPVAPPDGRRADYPHAISAVWKVSCLPQLEKSLSSKEPQERAAAAMVLVLAGASGSDTFQRWLNSEKEPFVIRTVRDYAEKRKVSLPPGASGFAAPAPIDPLKSFRLKSEAQLLEDLCASTGSTRHFAAETLAERDFKKLPQKVFEAEKINPEGVLLLIGASGNRQYAKRAAKFLEDGLHPEAGQITAAAIRALEKLGAEPYLKQLLPLGKAECREVRIALAETLAGIRRSDSAAVLEKLVLDYDEAVSLAAYAALRRNPRKDCLPFLTRALTEMRKQSARSRVECIRAVSAMDFLPGDAVKALERLILIKCMPGRPVTYDNPAVRAAALMALQIHRTERAAGKALEKALLTLDAKGERDPDLLPPLMAEYVRQIRLYSPGRPPVPALLPPADLRFVIRSL